MAQTSRLQVLKDMSRYQVKGVIISILFIVAGALLDLGRVFWIALVLFFVATAMYFAVWVVVRALRGNR